MRVATDVGGTFTDLVARDDDGDQSAQPFTAKCDSTPPRFEKGVQDVLQKADIDPARISLFAHGSTVIINAITERKGACTGLITTRGFRDVLELGRGNRPDLYNLMYAKLRPFVPRYLRQEITERVAYSGEVLTPIVLEELGEIVENFKSEGVEAIAVNLLHAYANPAHEIAICVSVRERWPEVSLVPSHALTRCHGLRVVDFDFRVVRFPSAIAHFLLSSLSMCHACIEACPTSRLQRANDIDCL